MTRWAGTIAALVAASGVACWAGLPAGAAEPEAAVSATLQPFELVRTLNALQDQAGQGNRAAFAAQQAMMRDASTALEQAPVEAWALPRNGRALIGFVLSGGHPAALQKVLREKVELAGVDGNLARATVAFAERRTDAAKTLFANVNVHELEPALAAQVALVKGIVDREPHLAIANFEMARLLAPGTLVEQSALRRQMRAESDLGHREESERLAAQYLRRFGRAVYAAGFYRELAEVFAAQPDTRDDGDFARLVTLLGQIEVPQRRQTYLYLAERSVLAGKVQMARFAAARASEMYDEGTRENARSRVYGAAADVATDRHDDGVSVLRELDRGKLGGSDIRLADAALEIASDVRREPVEVAAQDASAAGADTEAAPGQPSKVVELARKSLQRADELLKGKGK